MGGYPPAIGVVALSSLLGLLAQPLTAPLAYLGGGALALVTLRRGPLPGLVVMAGSALAVGLMGALALGGGVPLVVGAGSLWLPVWFAAMVLRRTVSLAWAVSVALGLGAVLVLAAHLAWDDPAQWWQDRLAPLVRAILKEGGPDLSDALPFMARWMTAMAAAALVFGTAVSLFIGRWWQAMLYNPGGFGREFRALQLGPQLGGATLLLMVAGMLLDGQAGRLATDLAVVLMTGFLFQGIALVHALVKASGRGRGWLVALYVLLVVAEPHAAVMLSLFGVADSWTRFRRQLPEAG